MCKKTTRKNLLRHFDYLQEVNVEGIAKHKKNINGKLGLICIEDVVIYSDDCEVNVDHIWVSDELFPEETFGKDVWLKGELASYTRRDGSYDYTVMPNELYI